MAGKRIVVGGLMGLAVVAAGCGDDETRNPAPTGNSTVVLNPTGTTPSGTTTGGTTTGGTTTGGTTTGGTTTGGTTTPPPVYLGDGQLGGGLADGSYTFAVLVPDLRDTGWSEGVAGNLSDKVAAGTPGDLGSGDDVACRTFTVQSGRIDATAYAQNACAHAITSDAAGAKTIQLTPFDADGTRGSYLLAICRLGATSAADCTFEPFSIERPATAGVVSGLAYYDANANGRFDPGETGLSSWPVAYSGAASGVVTSDAAGRFEVTLEPGDYSFLDSSAADPWLSVKSAADVSVASGRSLAALQPDNSYAVTVDGGRVEGLSFGQVCLGRGGSPGVGFWSNHAGEQLVGADDLELLVTLPLRNIDGSAFDPSSYDEFRTWFLDSNASNVAFKLSADVAAIELAVHNSLVSRDALVLATGTKSANALGYAVLGDVIDEATENLEQNAVCSGDDACVAVQQVLRDAIVGANSNGTFVQADPANCPAPVFAP